MRSAYLDHHATTPVDSRVLEAMLPFFREQFGNASSRAHPWGWAAAEAVKVARESVASLLGASPEELVFTSGATESNDLALWGAMLARVGRGKGHLVVSAIEHPSVLEPARAIAAAGASLTEVPPAPDGVVRVEAVLAALRPETQLVSLMLANNEVGTLQPVAELGAALRARGILLHSDVSQALAWVPCRVAELGVDLLSLSGHKLGGPKGVGALWVRGRPSPLRLEPRVVGGGQEQGLRAGTLNVPGIVGLGHACRLVEQERGADAARVGTLRDRLLTGLRAAFPELLVHGSLAQRLPNNLNLGLPGVEAAALLAALPEVALSTGSACASATPEPSHVLVAMGLSEAALRGAFRVGLGRETSAETIDFALQRLTRVGERLAAARREAGQGG